MSRRAALRGGFTALRRYPLLVAALYLVQVAVSALAGVVVARSLAIALADHPIVDRVAAGDVGATVLVVRELGSLLGAVAWASFGFVLLYVVISWLTTAGLIGTLLSRPVSRRHIAESFGASAATNAFAFARLWLWCLIPYAVVGLAVITGLGLGLSDAEDMLSWGDVAAGVLPPMVPGLLLWWMVNTAVDFARISLVRRRHKSALRALLRGFADTFTRRWPLPQAAIFYLWFTVVTVVYLNTTAGVEMSAAAYLLVRQLVGIARFVGKIWLIGGQVELAREHPGAPRS